MGGKRMKNIARHFHWVIGLFCCVFAASCDFSPDTGVRFDRRAFNRERNLWESQGIADYSFTEIYFPDFPAGNVRVTVSKNKAIAFDPLEGEDYTLFGETISDIYDKIEKDVAHWEEQFRTGASPHNIVEFTISYDEAYHFPEEVHFNIIEPGLSGGWYTVTIKDFVAEQF
jgi:hypothetical protein